MIGECIDCPSERLFFVSRIRAPKTHHDFQAIPGDTGSILENFGGVRRFDKRFWGWGFKETYPNNSMGKSGFSVATSFRSNQGLTNHFTDTKRHPAPKGQIRIFSPTRRSCHRRLCQWIRPAFSRPRQECYSKGPLAEVTPTSHQNRSLSLWSTQCERLLADEHAAIPKALPVLEKTGTP
jgi:hypothetical protein